MNKNIAVLALALGMVQFGGAASAEPQKWPWTPLDKICFINSGTVPRGVVAALRKEVIYGPYTSKCANFHKFQLGSLPYNIEQLKGGGWANVATPSFNTAVRLGAGTFRITVDNRTRATPLHHAGGTFSKPL